MDYINCPGCFERQRELNQRLQQAITDAQAKANTENTKVAVVQNGYYYRCISFSGKEPKGTVKVVEQV